MRPIDRLKAALTGAQVRSAARFVLPLAAFAMILLSARSSVADHYRVPTGSMRPTVQVGDRLFVNKAAYGLRLPFTSAYVTEFDGPTNGDVVVALSPEDGGLLVKRVVAVPGDHVAVRGGLLWLNGAPVRVERSTEGLLEHLGSRPHRIRLDAGPGPAYGPLRIPARRYLLMGDNRGDSHDGRLFGLVKRSAIRGQVLGVYFRGGGFTWKAL